MNECLLLFGFDSLADSLTAANLKSNLEGGGIPVHKVPREDYKKPLGMLVAERAFAKPAGDVPENEKKPAKVHLDTKMILMSGMSGDRIDEVIDLIKKNGIGREVLKAVLTRTNSGWNAVTLLEHLKEERRQMEQIK